MTDTQKPEPLSDEEIRLYKTSVDNLSEAADPVLWGQKAAKQMQRIFATIEARDAEIAALKAENERLQETIKDAYAWIDGDTDLFGSRPLTYGASIVRDLLKEILDARDRR